jgi:ArsR family transcriptional regulator
MASAALTNEVTQLHAELCSALADPSRILMLYALAKRPRNVSELALELDLTQSAASRHLKTLRERGLAQATRRGASVEYQLTDHRLIEALDLLRSVLRDRLSYRASLVTESEESPA